MFWGFLLSFRVSRFSYTYMPMYKGTKN